MEKKYEPSPLLADYMKKNPPSIPEGLKGDELAHYCMEKMKRYGISLPKELANERRSDRYMGNEK